MKTVILSIVSLLPLAFGTVLPAPAKVDYTGFKGIRVTLPDDAPGVRDQISKLAKTVLNPGSQGNLDVVVAPENVRAVTELAANATVLVEDMAVALAEEDVSTVYAGVCFMKAL
jgi:hypothetical protein